MLRLLIVFGMLFPFTDFLHFFADQIAFVPDAFGHFAALGMLVDRSGYGLHGMVPVVMVNNSFIGQRGLPDRLLLLIDGVADNGPQQGAYAGPDQGGLRIVPDDVTRHRARTGGTRRRRG